MNTFNLKLAQSWILANQLEQKNWKWNKKLAKNSKKCGIGCI